MTAEEMVEDALTEIRVKPIGVDLEDAYVTRGIRALNQMMAAYSAIGRGLGYTPIAAKTETVTVPDWAEEYVMLDLAMTLAESFGKQVSPQTLSRYERGRRAVLHMTVSMPDRQYFPETLPRGAGNEGSFGWDVYTDGGSSGAFFGPEHENDLLDGNGDMLLDDEGFILEDDENITS